MDDGIDIRWTGCPCTRWLIVTAAAAVIFVNKQRPDANTNLDSLLFERRLL